MKLKNKYSNCLFYENNIQYYDIFTISNKRLKFYENKNITKNYILLIIKNENYNKNNVSINQTRDVGNEIYIYKNYYKNPENPENPDGTDIQIQFILYKIKLIKYYIF